MNSIKILRGINAIGGRLLPGPTARAARRLLMTPRQLPPRDWEKAAIESAQSFTLPNGLCALRWGEAGPIVLCIHGWEGRPSQFARFVQPLVAAGYQVIALHAPAHGDSPGKEANPLVFMRAILESAAALGPLAMIIGHSMGAGAAALAIDRGLDVQSAVLISGPSGLRNVLQRFAGFVGLPKRARRRFYRIVEEHTDAPLDTVEIQALAHDFQVPALIVHDRDDPMMPFAEAGQVVKHWPGAKLLATTGLGHYKILRDANVVSTVASFARFANSHRQAA